MQLLIFILYFWSPFCFRSSNFAIAKDIALNLLALFFIGFVHWFMASFLYCFLSGDSENSKNVLLFPVRATTLVRIKIIKNWYKKLAEKCIMDNFKMSKMEKSKNAMNNWNTIIISHFGCTNIILVESSWILL